MPNILQFLESRRNPPFRLLSHGEDLDGLVCAALMFKAVEGAAKRNVNNFDMQLNAKWNGNDIEIFLNITNEDSVPHFEHLRVYILEVESRWTDYNGDKIRYALMDYAFNLSLIHI